MTELYSSGNADRQTVTIPDSQTHKTTKKWGLNMDRTERREQQIAHAKEHFAHHKAIFRQLDGMSTLDWRNENGSSNYYVRYVFDESHGFLYISGDLGTAAVELTERATLKALSDYEVGYFMEKIRCSTNLYCYDAEIAKEDLTYYVQNYLGSCEEDLSDRKVPLPKEFDVLLESLDERDGWNLTEEQKIWLSERCPDYWEWLYSTGKYIDTRVVCWLVGLQMAWKQVKDKLVDSLTTGL